MEFRILGPVEVVDNGRSVTISGKQRVLLAVLLLEPRQVVSRERLVDALWEDDPPETASKSVQVFAGRLRTAVPGLPLITRGGGYVLDVDASAIDRDRFEILVSEASDASRAGSSERAAELLREALGLWRGPPLADVKEPFARRASAVLGEQRLMALEDRIDADLALGRHRQLIAELEALVVEHRLRERLRGQLMLALYRSGRQAEALEIYSQFRRTLVDELGLEPSRELQRLQQQILAQDGSLDARRPAALESPVRTAGRRRLVLGATVVAVIAVAAAVGTYLVERSSANSITLHGRAVARLDPRTADVAEEIPLGATPLFLAPDSAGVWAATQEGTVVHVDAVRGRVDRTASVGFRPSGLVAEKGGAWVGNLRSPVVEKVSRRYERIVERVRLPRVSDRAVEFGTVAPRLAEGGGFLWVTSGQTTVVRIDPRTNRTAQLIAPTTAAVGPIAYGAGGVWVGGSTAVARVSPASGVVVSTIPLDAAPAAIAVDHGALWIALAKSSQIVRVDAYEDRVVARIDVGGRVKAMAAGGRAVWAIAGGTLIRIDSRTNAITRRLHLRGRPTALAVAGNSVWIASG